MNPPPFFIPADVLNAAMTQDQAWSALCAYNRVPLDVRRAWRLSWTHNGMDMEAEVGKPAPRYYQTPGPVIAIIHNGICWCVITHFRGFAEQPPIYADTSGNPTPFAT